MADDIDDLLNEVEDKYLVGGKGSAKRSSTQPKMGYPVTGTASSGSRHTGSNIGSGRKKSEIDSMIDDLDNIMHDSKIEQRAPYKAEVRKHQPLSQQTSSGGNKSRCFPVWMGGSSCVQGQATAVHQRCCNMLRCTDCDFQISSFDNVQWHNSTDYLFLRNNMPDYEKLKPKLVNKKGLRAYACQCKWKSIKDPVNLESVKDVKWVCGKH